MLDLAALSAVVCGRVQGVNFRSFVVKHARELGLTGYVRNLTDDRKLEVYAEGERERLRMLLEHLGKGPLLAKVERVEANWVEYTGALRQFSIRN